MQNITCPDCGSNMVPYHPLRDLANEKLKAVGRPHHSRKSRLKKKFHKQWLKRNHTVLMTTLFVMPAMGPPRFRCESCNRIDGFYQSMGRILTAESR